MAIAESLFYIKTESYISTSSATAEIDDGPCGASTLSSWRSESSNISLVVLDKLLFGFHFPDLLEK